MKKAREIRDIHFPGQIFFVRPNSTTVITTTGKKCNLNCSHCGGKYLNHMIPITEAGKEIARRKSTSCLISGGCSHDGRVSINLEPLKSVVNGLKVNAHVGLISEEEIKSIATYVDCVSFDFLVDNDTIKEVYHMNKTGDDYIKTYQMLQKYVKVMPHICIGLKGGEIKGEYQAIDTLARLGVEGLVFIIFIPTRGTDYADRKPPALEEVLKLMVYARETFPDIPIHLGCMRPGGRYRAEIDYYAVEVGLNKIVNPTPLAIKRAKELGYKIVYEEECCVL
ncbi:radical SAM protein [Anoxybacter fermentans]|uniref:Radical SAM protein n=1 Tax=Anoxybacter fermentans TaxID=1323375 RepID=A0A3S9T2T1_9FIRM|nr:radical SAM protein [Anoxybacter fermentans]